MVYETYQEANIAHPYRDIYVSIGGKFAPDFYVAHIALCGIKEGWNKYQPQPNEFNTDSIAVTEQEEEEFNAMANSSEIPNSSGWKNGDECVYDGDLWQFVSLLSSEFHGTAVIFDRISEELKQVDFSRLKKPETPEQIAERERMEAAYDLYTHVQSVRGQLSCKFDWFSNSEMEETRLRFLAIVDKTGYRLTK